MACWTFTPVKTRPSAVRAADATVWRWLRQRSLATAVAACTNARSVSRIVHPAPSARRRPPTLGPLPAVKEAGRAVTQGRSAAGLPILGHDMQNPTASVATDPVRECTAASPP